MAITVQCRCGKQFRFKDEAAGKAGKCGACGTPFKVPAASAAPPDPSARPEAPPSPRPDLLPRADATAPHTPPGDGQGRAGDLGRRLLRETQATGAATVSQTRRLAAFGRALWRRHRLGRTAAASAERLGAEAFAAGLGDATVRQAVAALDDQLKSAAAAKRPTRALQSQRRALLHQLGAALLSQPRPPEAPAESFARAQADQAAARQQAAAVTDLKGRLAPQDRTDRRRVAAGYGVALGCALLGWYALSGPAPEPAARELASSAPATGPADAGDPPGPGGPTSDAPATTAAAARAAAAPPRKPASAPPPPATGEPLDLRVALKEAGFAADLRSDSSIEHFVRYGTAALATKAARGDQFDRLEVEKQVQGRAAQVAARPYLFRDLPITVPNRNDFEKTGLVVVAQVGLRLDTAQAGDQGGALTGVHPCWANLRDFWFLTKDQTLRRCASYQEAELLRRNNGILYHPEARTTDLLLTLRVDVEKAKHVTRNPKGYALDLVVDRLRFERAWEWGYFRLDDLTRENWDCGKVLEADLGAAAETSSAPGYFRVDLKQMPWVVRADLVSATFKDQAGQVIGAYQRLAP